MTLREWGFPYKNNDRQGFCHLGRIVEFRTNSIYFSKDKLAVILISNDSKINEIYIEIVFYECCYRNNIGYSQKKMLESMFQKKIRKSARFQTKREQSSSYN